MNLMEGQDNDEQSTESKCSESKCSDVQGDIITKVDHNFNLVNKSNLEAWEKTRPKGYIKYRERWNNAPIDKLLEKFPIHLDVEATSHCNLLCTMCPRTDMVNDGSFWKIEHTDFELYKRLIDEGVTKGLCSVKFNYLGEPLMNRELFKWIAYAKEKGVIDVMFNTNATMLNETNARKIIASGLDKLFFSFDSPDKEHYEKIRVNGKFERTFSNIVRFHEIREEMNSSTPYTRVSMVRMKENEHECEKFVQLFENIVDSVGICEYLDHTSQNHGNNKNSSFRKMSRNTFCCPQLWQRMFVHPDGLVTPCCNDSARSLIMGNIHENNVEDIWLGEKYMELRELHATGRIQEVDTCSKCALANLALMEQ